MKLAITTTTPDVLSVPPVALLAGDFAARLRRAAELGYDGVELMVVQPAALDGAAILRSVHNAGLRVAAVASGAIPFGEGLTLLAASPAASQAAQARLAGLIHLAARVEAPLVTVGSLRGRLAWAGGAPARAQLLAMLQAAAEEATSLGVRIVIEPLNRYETDIVVNVAEGLALLSEIDHPAIGLLVDTFHANIEEPSITGSLQLAMQAGRLWHVHLGDSNRLAPGRGHLDFGAVVTTLTEIGYQGYLSAELLARPDADTAATETVQHLRQLLPS